MMIVTAKIALAFLMAWAASAAPRAQENDNQRDVKLPSGKSQSEEILKADHEKSLKEADELIKLSEELKADLVKNDRHVLSIATLKKVEEIEKIARRIRSRLRRF